MYEWQRQIQTVVDEIDRGIREHRNEELTLQTLSSRLGYSEFHMTRKFREISGMQFKEYLRNRKLAFALKEIRDTDRRVLGFLAETELRSGAGLRDDLRTAGQREG